MNTNASLVIKFDAGTSIEYAFEEAIRVSKILLILIEFNFNGVICWGNSNGNAQEGAKNYQEALSSIRPFKCAHC